MDIKNSRTENTYHAKILKDGEYWIEKLSGDFSRAALHYDDLRHGPQEKELGALKFTLPGQITQKLVNMSNGSDIRLYMLLLSAVILLIYKYTGHEDIVTGCPIMERKPDIEYLNSVLALRNRITGKMTFKGLLLGVKETVEEAVLHQDYPIEHLLHRLGMAFEGDDFPLFDIAVMLEGIHIKESIQHTRSNLIFCFSNMQEAVIQVTIEYNSFRYSRDTIERTGLHLVNLLREAVSNINISVADIEMLSEKEIKQILYEFNTTEAAYPSGTTICRIFEDQAAKTPGRTAVIAGDRRISYEVLNRKANQLSNTLRRKGIQRAEIAAIIADRPPEMLAGILGIWKAGGAYLPISPHAPESRIKFLLEDSGSRLILTQKRFIEKVSFNCEVIDLEDGDSYTGSGENPGDVSSPSDLAYVIYTSGSTGQPKGVMIEHTSLVNRLNWMNHQYAFNSSDIFLQKTPYTFDVSVWELFLWCMEGASVCLLEPGGESEPEIISEAIQKYGITTIHFVPSMLNAFLEYIDTCKGLDKLKTLRRVFASGEALTPQQVIKFNRILNKKWGSRLYNLYGPTEATIDVSYFNCPEDFNSETVPIGKPIDNIKLYVLNKGNGLAPVGVPGELFISGVGLARGYLKREELTDMRFVPNPFQPGERMYSTGDLARWLPDGNIEFLGRTDYQVKIRGYRIELGEIEQQLNRFPGITASVVSIWDEGPHKLLTAYYTSEKDIGCDILKKYLSKALPEYMIPAFFVRLERMPFNANGKADRKALPPPTRNSSAKNSQVMPRNELEQKLKEVWSSLLRQENIGMYDDFFSIGGDSILVIEAVSGAREKGIFLTPKHLVENPTIAALAEIADSLEEASRNTVKRMKSHAANGEFGLTPIQKWFVEEEFEDPHYFNQSQMIVIECLDLQRLERAVAELTKHHHAFKIRFGCREGEYFQYYHPNPPPMTVKCFKLQATGNPGAEIMKVCEAMERQLDYISGPTLAVGVISGHPDGMDRLFIAVHHIIIDSVSWRILLKDLYDLYHQKQLLPASSTLEEWYGALLEYARSERTSLQLSYWQKLIRQIECSRLPTDFNQNGPTGKGNHELFFALDRNDTEILTRKCTGTFNTQISNLLVSAWALSLTRWSECPTVAFKLEGHGREICVPDVDVTRTIGWFTSVFPVCISIPSSDSLESIINSVGAQLREIPDNGLSYGVLRYCHPDKNVRDSLKTDCRVSLNYLGQFDSFGSQGDTWIPFSNDTAQDRSSPENHSMNILESNCSIVDNTLNIYIQYSALHFKKATIEKFSNLFLSNLKSIIAGAAGHGDCRDIKYPLSPLQRGLLFHYTQNPKSDQYYVQVMLDINGFLDLVGYRKAWQRLMDENEALRTYFVWEGLEAPFQGVVDTREVPWTFMDISSLPAAAQQEKIGEIAKADRENRFILNKAPLFRNTIIKQGHFQWRVILSYHHIILDGLSIDVLLKNAHQIYSGLVETGERYKGRAHPEEYINWLLNKDKTEGAAYWQNKLSTLEHTTDIPSRLPGTVLDIHKPIGRQQDASLFIGSEQLQKYRCFAKENHITLNTLIQFAWSKLLHAYNRDDVTVSGIVVSGRAIELSGMDSAVGMFINTVPLVVRWDSAKPVKEHLAGLHKSIQEANLYSDIGLDEMKSLSSIKGQAIFYSIATFENYTDEWAEGLKTINIRRVGVNEKTNYPITISVRYRREEIEIKVFYDADCFEDQTIKCMLHHMLNIMNFIVRFPGCNIHDIDMMDIDEFHNTVKLLDNSACTYPVHQTIAGLFEKQVRQNPGSTAIIDQGHIMTYQELDERAADLGRMLRTKGVRPSTPVGICVNRSIYMVVGILGILKAGGAYVPIDPDYPGERIRYMLEDSGATIVLTLDGMKESLGELCSSNLVALDREDSYDCGSGGLEDVNNPGDPAYVIYTSGTTGMPKGVVIEHKNVVRLLFNDKFQFDFSSQDIWTAFHSICFDFSVWEIFGALLYGGKLVIVSKEAAMDARLFHKILLDNKVTVLNQTPQAFYNLITIDQSSISSSLQLRYVIFGGEALSPDRLKPWKEKYKKTRLINMYGITETTVHATYKELTEEDLKVHTSNIGRPIPTLKAYIVDRYMKQLPVGVPGELYIGGEGVGRGYINNQELTGEKFVINPYNPAERLYKSGDLVRLLPSGEMEYLGRIDKQVKIRGFRVELGEIESVIRKFPYVKDCVVLAREDKSQNKTLVAYVVAETLDGLGEYLKDKLPYYMTPSFYIQLARIPLTANKKVDWGALSPPENAFNTQVEDAAPRNEIEQKLAAVMQQVLGVGRIGIRDSFYTLGGHSLNALHVVSLLQKEGIHLTVSQIFKEQTIENLSRVAVTGDSPFSSPRSRGAKGSRLLTFLDGAFPLSAVQRRFFKRELVDRNVFNVPYICLLKKYLYMEMIKSALEELIKRHQALRLTFGRTEDGTWYQYCRNTQPDDVFLYVDLHLQHGKHDAFITQFTSELQKQFKLEGGALFKLVIFDHYMDEDKQVMVMLFHHLAFDGISLHIFLDEFKKLVSIGRQGNSVADFPDKKLSYQDWCLGLVDYAAENEFDEARRYWQGVLEGGQSLRSDLSPGVQPTHKNMDTIKRVILEDRQKVKLLKEKALRSKTTNLGILLAALWGACQDVKKQSDILLHLMSYQRESFLPGISIRDTMGFFAGAYPIRLKALSCGQNTDNIMEIFEAVREILYRVPKEGLDYLVLKYLLPDIVKEAEPLNDPTDMLFHYMSEETDFVNDNLYQYLPIPIGNTNSPDNPSNYLLNMTAILEEGRLSLSCYYSQLHYKPETILKLFDSFNNRLNEILNRDERGA